MMDDDFTSSSSSSSSDSLSSSSEISLSTSKPVTASATAVIKRGRDEENSGEILKDLYKKKCTPTSKEPKASAASEVPRGDGLEPKYLPPIAAAMADEDGHKFLIKAMASFPTKVADQSLSGEVTMGLLYLTDKDRKLFLPFVKHFGWIVGPFPSNNPCLEEVKRGFYLGVARFLSEVAFVKSRSADAVSISNLQKCLKTMAETMKLKEEFVSFISQYLDKMLALQRVKKSAALVRIHEARLSEAKKVAAESELEYNKPWHQ